MADGVATRNRKRRYNRRENVESNDDCAFSDVKKELQSQYFPSRTNHCLSSKLNSKLKRQKIEALVDEELVLELEGKPEAISPTLKLKLTRTFYDTPTIDLAKKLLGKHIFRIQDDGEVLVGRIVETEGYLGESDKACHSYGGKRTSRNEPMFMIPGTAYVYFIYGMYYCLNISSEEPGACVLIRALEPIKGLDTMKKLRGAKHKDKGASLKDFQLCNGPSKLCQALSINKSNLNKEDMAISSQFWLEGSSEREENIHIVTSTRIGIDSYGQDSASQPLRFYILGSKSVSVKDKKAEAALDG